VGQRECRDGPAPVGEEEEQDDEGIDREAGQRLGLQMMECRRCGPEYREESEWGLDRQRVLPTESRGDSEARVTRNC
jgi:hypothetical protein